MSTPNEKMIAINLAEALKLASERMPLMLEVYAQMAREAKAKFDAHVEAGFSPEQALFLVKS